MNVKILITREGFEGRRVEQVKEAFPSSSHLIDTISYLSIIA